MQNSFSKFKELYSKQVISKENQSYFKGGKGYDPIHDEDGDGIPFHDEDFDGIP